MKKLILASIMSAILPFAVSAGELIPATTLKIISPDGLTDLQSLKVELGTICKYSSGIFWPESKSCGSKSTKLKVEADGSIKIPSIEKFSGIRGSKTDNYDVSLVISEGENYLTVLSSRGKEALADFKFENKPLSIFRLEAAEINVSTDGADFFNTELAKIDRAYLFISINDKSAENKLGKVMIVTPMEGSSLWFKENFASYAGKELLKDQTSIKLPKLSYAKFNANGKEILDVSVHYDISNNYDAKTKRNGKVEVALTPSALSEIGTIEIKN